jgi:hypothetical protein
MTTATAAEPRTTTSPKYRGWAIQKFADDNYLMTREGGIYAIDVTFTADHGWTGEILTRQYRDGSKSWELARTPFQHCVAGCIAEADRRESWIAKQASRKTN